MHRPLTMERESETQPGSESLALSRREILFIAAFWAGYALLAVANRLFEQGGPGGPPGSIGAHAAVAAIEAACWATLTVPFFWVATKLDFEQGDETARRVRSLATMLLVVLLAAAVMGWISTELRTTLTPRGPRPGAGGGRGRGGPPIWFGLANSLVIALGVLSAGIARAYSLRYRARREQAVTLQAQLVEARLDALRRQLDPHFLFNTLNAVSALVERDPKGVRRMIARLSELLRHSFEGGGAPEVPLRDELALLGRYLDIMQVRFQGRLTVETRVDERALDALVPTLILQPLVENAIRHGVEKRVEGGRIDVEATVDGDVLALRVSDNGPDAATPAPPEARNGNGVGVRNTVARLEQLYGARQRFSLGPGSGGGTVAEVRLPLHHAPAPMHDDFNGGSNDAR